MKKYLCLHYILLGMLLFVSGCSGADFWDSMPAGIKSFIDLYYPNSEINSYAKGKDSYSVRLANGPGFEFNGDQHWTYINGYGLPLKQILVYDQTPGPLYDYLETIGAAAGVFTLARDEREYRLNLLQDSLVYTISTEQVRTVGL